MISLSDTTNNLFPVYLWNRSCSLLVNRFIWRQRLFSQNEVLPALPHRLLQQLQPASSNSLPYISQRLWAAPLEAEKVCSKAVAISRLKSIVKILRVLIHHLISMLFPFILVTLPLMERSVQRHSLIHNLQPCEGKDETKPDLWHKALEIGHIGMTQRWHNSTVYSSALPSVS